MIGRDIERLEVVPFILDLRPIGHRETEPPHDFLEFLDRLRERMEMADPRANAGDCRIEDRFGGHGGRLLQPLVRRGERGLNRLFDLVEPLAGGRLFGGHLRAQTLLRGSELPALSAKEFNTSRFQCFPIAHGLESRASSRTELIELGEKIPSAPLGVVDRLIVGAIA